MAADSEIIAILSSGISYKRMLFPYFLSSLILAIFSLILINWVIPPANKKRLEFENTYVKRRYYNSEKNIHRQILSGVYIYMESYNNIYNIGYKFSMEEFENGKLKSKLMSDYIQWDTTKQTWKISNYYIRDFIGDKQIILKGRKIDSAINLKPEQFARRNNVVEAMNHKELNKFIEEEKMRGSDNVTLWIIEKNKRLAFPFSTIILTLIGVTLSSRKKRGGIGTNIGLGILLAFTYILFMQVSMVLATNANVNPVFAVWIPNILYAAIGLFLYYKAAK
jgi:lipopolysaccharide export system permease protein